MGFSLDDLLGVMNDKDRWQNRVMGNLCCQYKLLKDLVELKSRLYCYVDHFYYSDNEEQTTSSLDFREVYMHFYRINRDWLVEIIYGRMPD